MLKRNFGTGLVEEGFINQAHLDEVVRLQMEAIADPASGVCVRIGENMVNAGMFTDDALRIPMETMAQD